MDEFKKWAAELDHAFIVVLQNDRGTYMGDISAKYIKSCIDELLRWSPSQEERDRKMEVTG